MNEADAALIERRYRAILKLNLPKEALAGYLLGCTLVDAGFSKELTAPPMETVYGTILQWLTLQVPATQAIGPFVIFHQFGLMKLCDHISPGAYSWVRLAEATTFETEALAHQALKRVLNLQPHSEPGPLKDAKVAPIAALTFGSGPGPVVGDRNASLAEVEASQGHRLLWVKNLRGYHSEDRYQRDGKWVQDQWKVAPVLKKEDTAPSSWTLTRNGTKLGDFTAIKLAQFAAEQYRTESRKGSKWILSCRREDDLEDYDRYCVLNLVSGGVLWPLGDLAKLEAERMTHEEAVQLRNTLLAQGGHLDRGFGPIHLLQVDPEHMEQLEAKRAQLEAERLLRPEFGPQG